MHVRATSSSTLSSFFFFRLTTAFFLSSPFSISQSKKTPEPPLLPHLRRRLEVPSRRQAHRGRRTLRPRARYGGRKFDRKKKRKKLEIDKGGRRRFSQPLLSSSQKKKKKKHHPTPPTHPPTHLHTPTAKDGTKHLGLKLDRIRHWLSQGAQPSKPVASLLHRAGIAPAPPRSAPKLTGVKNAEKRPAKTAASFAAAGIEQPSGAAAAAGSA